STCPISIQDKMKATEAKPIIDLDRLPGPSKNFRTFEQNLKFTQVSEEDETVLFENPELVPEKYRASIPSLVWLALLDMEKRNSILNKVSASEIASAWVGAPVVL